jgi:Janus/Ocnus family (Ocnus)
MYTMKRATFVIIDYGGFSRQPAPGKMTPDRTTGKFVQIRNNDTEYILFSPRELAQYHADLVERFCEERNIPGSYVRERRRYDIHDPEWVVVGGGKFETDGRKKSILLYDNSMAYGKFDPKGLKEKIHRTKELAHYTVRIM